MFSHQDMKVNYLPEDIRGEFDSGAVRRGTDYYLQDKVVNVADGTNENVLSGVVNGSNSNQYRVNIIISPGVNAVHFRSSCSCPVRSKCKHAVAVLLYHWFQTQHAQTELPVLESEQNHAENQWLASLETALSASSKDESISTPGKVTNRLLYVLTMQKNGANHRLSVDYCNARKLKAGGYGKTAPYDVTKIKSKPYHNFILDDDVKILRRVYARMQLDDTDFRDLSSSEGGEILLEMIVTGRCYWENINSTPLSIGEPRQAKLNWKNYEDASQKLVFELEDASGLVLPTIPPIYYDNAENCCGPIDVDVPSKAFYAIQSSPVIPAESIPQFSKRVKSLLKNVPDPEEIITINKTDIVPIPHLHMTLYNGKRKTYRYENTYENEPVIDVNLDYEGKKTSLFEKGVSQSYLDKNQLITFKRNLSEESKILQQLKNATLVAFTEAEDDITLPDDLFTLSPDVRRREEERWMVFLTENLPQLRQSGWQVSFDDDFPYRLAEVDDWVMNVEEVEEGNWFDLSLGITVEGENYNLIQLVSALLRQKSHLFFRENAPNFEPPKRVLMRLPTGKVLLIPYERVSLIVNVLLELFDDKKSAPEKMRLPKWRVAELKELQSSGLRWNGLSETDTVPNKLGDFDGLVPLEPPSEFNAKLRHYQKEGLAWLQFLREYQFHGILADDMGLGKTVQTLAHIATEKAAGRLKKPVLIVAPTSLMFNWRREAEYFSPDLSVLILQGPERKKYFSDIEHHDIVLTSYPLLGRDDKVLLEQHWHLLILDEAQNIKNAKAKSTRIACQLRAKHRLCLTGTPMENHLGELWSMFHFLMPGLLGDEKQFRHMFRNPIEKMDSKPRAERLSKRISPFVLRRTKDEVIKELPEKTEIIRTVRLEGAQRDLYETVRAGMQEKVLESIDSIGLNSSHIIVLDALLKLRQICCDPRLLKSTQPEDKIKSAKLDLLMTLLPELLEEGRRILLFSQFTSMLALIEAELKSQKIEYVKLTGSTKDRESPISTFQDGDVPLFLISLKAGGTGLNLTAADTVIHYDPWWNPAVESQATDRAHRMGQKNPVFVYKLLTEGTVESKIVNMQKNKRKLADSLFDIEGNTKLPDAESLQGLFEPLR